MKKFLVLALISLFVLSVFVACGSGDSNMKDEITTMMDDVSSGMSEIDDDLTQGGNITSDGSTTGENLLEEIMPDDDKTTDAAEDSTTDSAVTDEGTTEDSTNAADK